MAKMASIFDEERRESEAREERWAVRKTQLVIDEPRPSYN